MSVVPLPAERRWRERRHDGWVGWVNATVTYQQPHHLTCGPAQQFRKPEPPHPAARACTPQNDSSFENTLAASVLSMPGMGCTITYTSLRQKHHVHHTSSKPSTGMHAPQAHPTVHPLPTKCPIHTGRQLQLHPQQLSTPTTPDHQQASHSADIQRQASTPACTPGQAIHICMASPPDQAA